MTSVLGALALGSAAGINAYATLLVLGLLVRTGVVGLDSPTALFFARTEVLAVLAVLYAVEFAADKVPAVDHVWDAVHTFVRPIAGAAAAVAVVSGHHAEGWAVLAAVLGGATSLLFHGGKATFRVGVTAATAGTGNWAVSLAEDAVAIGTSVAGLMIPAVAGVIVLAVIVWIAVRIGRRRRAAAR